jgi:hypothetical protein
MADHQDLLKRADIIASTGPHIAYISRSSSEQIRWVVRDLAAALRANVEQGARAIWDDFGGECGNDADYCRWTGDEKTVGKCYCQQVAWRHARLAIEGKKP